MSLTSSSPVAAADHSLIRCHAIILIASWLVGTVLVLQANTVVPMTLPAPVNVDDLARLRAGWSWYATGYGLFFVADCGIALLGAVLVSWLGRPVGFRSSAIVLLFALSGILGILGILTDVEMVGAAQSFRLGSPALNPATAAAWLDTLNTSCNWLSTASFLPAGIGTWLVCAAARQAGVGRGWIAFTRIGTLYQIATGLISAAAFLSGRPVLVDVSLVAAVFGLPVYVTIWLAWTLHEMKLPSEFPEHRRQQP